MKASAGVGGRGMVFQRGAERSLCGVAVVALLGLTAPPLLAQPLSNDLETKLLELERTLEQQRLEIQALREELLELQRGRGPVDTGVRQAQQSPPPAQPPRQQPPPQQLPPQQPVGQPPEPQPPRPAVQAIPELGGVLQPKGKTGRAPCGE